ncbi:hypothetical protein JL721_8867 [Aureococcus anophagefferens]|nr:hypothetical protein JL721_8867 [Aureococcus anophagefferens]
MADGVLTRGAIQGVLRSFRVWAMYTHMAGVAFAKEVDHDVALRAAVTHTRKTLMRAGGMNAMAKAANHILRYRGIAPGPGGSPKPI